MLPCSVDSLVSTALNNFSSIGHTNVRAAPHSTPRAVLCVCVGGRLLSRIYERVCFSHANMNDYTHT